MTKENNYYPYSNYSGVKIQVRLTSTRLLAYLIFLVGAVYGFIDLIYIKSGSGAMILTTAMATASGTIAIKTGTDAFRNWEIQRDIEQQNNNFGGNNV